MTKKQHQKVDLCHVIDAYGGRQSMAETLGGLTRQAIEQWTEIPVHWVLRIESDTGYSRHQQRPDIYGSAPVDVSSRAIPASRALEKQRPTKPLRKSAAA